MAKKQKSQENKEEQKVSIWRDRIQTAVDVQKDFDNRYGYTRAMLEYRGQYKEAMQALGNGLTDIPIIAINEVKAFVRTFLPSIYSRDPIINVNPQGRKSIQSSKIFEKAINALWREIKLKREVRRCIVDACLGPWGWVKTGYAAQFGEHEIKEGKPQFESNEFIEDEEIYAVRESWKNIVYDTEAINAPHDCRWMAHRITKPLKAVKESKVYSNTEGLDGGTVEARQYMDETGKHRNFNDEPQAVLWEIWDKDSNKVYTVAEGVDAFLLERDWPYKIKKFPFIGITFDVNPDENYPQNFVGAWEPQLWEKIKMRSMVLDHLKRFGRQLAAEQGALDPVEKEKFEQGKTGTVITYRKGKTPPTPIQYPPVQSDMYAIMNSIEYDKDNISGQSAIVRGAPQKTQSRTIGEIDRLIGSNEGRNADPQDLVEDFSEDIAYYLKALMQEFTTLPKFVSATQEEEQAIIAALGEGRYDGTGFEYTNEDINDDYDIDIKAGSTLPLNRANRIKLLDQVMRNGAAMGVKPGGKVSFTIGKSILSDLELYEVELAYEEEIAELEAQKQAMIQMAKATGQGVAAGGELPELNAKRGRPATPPEVGAVQ